jgi:hypothetical protein
MFNILASREMQIKTTFGFYFTPPMKTKKTNVGDDVRKKEPFYVFGGM